MLEYESLSQLIRRRRSVRVYNPNQHISWDDLIRILEAAIWAPTASNQQELRFMIITDRQAINKMLSVKPLKNATAMILIFYDTTLQYYRDYKKSKVKHPLPYLDAGACSMNMLLAAESLGIHACWLNVVPSLKRPRDKRSSKLIVRIIHTLLEKLNHFFNLGYFTYGDLIYRKWLIPRKYQILTAIAFGYGKFIPDITKALHYGNPIMRKSVEEHIIKIYEM